jgi:hypothetical protein
MPPEIIVQWCKEGNTGEMAESACFQTRIAARRFFERRLSPITRAFGSPNIPRTIGSARKPGNEYVSQSRRRRFDARAINQSCLNSKSRKMLNSLAVPRFLAFSTQKLPTRFREDPLK